MNKKLIGTIIIIIFLIIASVLYFNIKSKSNTDTTNADSAENLKYSNNTIDENATSENSSSSNTTPSDSIDSSEADETLSNFGEVGKAYTLHSRSYKQGDVRDNSAPSLGWDGDLELFVSKAEAYEFTEDLYEQYPKLADYATEVNNPYVVHVELSLKNIDAANKNGVKYEFYSNMFRLSAYYDLILHTFETYEEQESYMSISDMYVFSEFSVEPHGSDEDYFVFQLEEGETKEFTLDYLVNGDYFSQKDIFLGVSLSSTYNYGILLTDLQK